MPLRPQPYPHPQPPPPGQRAFLARKRRNRLRALSLAVELLGLLIFGLLLRYLDWMLQSGPWAMVDNTGFIIILGLFGLAALVAAAIIWPRR